MRKFIKFLLIILILFGFCYDYKLITIDKYGFQTVFNSLTFGQEKIDTEEATIILGHTKNIYSYRVNKLRFYVFETDEFGNILLQDSSTLSASESNKALIKLFATFTDIDMISKNVIPWYLYLIAIFFSYGIPPLQNTAGNRNARQ